MLAAEKTRLVDNAMGEVISQRRLFWKSRARKLKRLSPRMATAIERGEELLKEAQKKTLNSVPSFSLL